MSDNEKLLNLTSLKVGDFLSYCEDDIYLILKIDKQFDYFSFDFLYLINNQVIKGYKIWITSDFAKRAFRKWPHNDE